MNIRNNLKQIQNELTTHYRKLVSLNPMSNILESNVMWWLRKGKKKLKVYNFSGTRPPNAGNCPFLLTGKTRFLETVTGIQRNKYD